ncbi:MAG TPA: RecX family transcriptional regulator [Anaerolineaceae bacterium]|nr:RecX family transcriptional regulator [Anaerolineaceae bacterium]
MQKTITAITKQTKNANRVNIFLDGTFAFGLFLISAVGLKIGQTLSQLEIDQLMEIDQIESGYQKSLKFIAYKPRTKFDVLKKLQKLGFEEKIINQILSKLVDKGYIDDQQFARNWIENKSYSKPRSKRLISWELKNKKIDKDLIEDLLEIMDPDEVLAVRAAEKHSRRISNCDDEIFKRRLSGFLQRRGFSYSIIKPVVNDLLKKRSQELIEKSNE